MKQIRLNTTVKKMLADVYTPVGIYLRLRDRFRDTILLESTDSHATENSYSFIGVNAIGGIEIQEAGTIETKYPNQPVERAPLKQGADIPALLWDFMQRFELQSTDAKNAAFAQGLYGYFTFDVIPLVEKIAPKADDASAIGTSNRIPLARYRLYQYVIAINHHRDELLLLENELEGVRSESSTLISLIQNKDVPLYPFNTVGTETSNMEDAHYLGMVNEGIAACLRGDVFQIVLSRRFEQGFTGDEFNVYRALRHINPSPYLFFFDYGDYKLMGSSPEAQLIIQGDRAVMHPIAGTFRRTGNDAEDKLRAEELLLDPKENAEHVMLVDLARNDLSRICSNVGVGSFKQIQFYSHVIHLVSEVTGRVAAGTNPFEVIFKTFPAGTLSGAPKHKALQLISKLEPTVRSFYGGTLGFIGFNGSCNTAIMIRSFLSRENRLYYQAGAGVVAASDPKSELQEVANKLNALKNAVHLAEQIVF